MNANLVPSSDFNYNDNKFKNNLFSRNKIKLTVIPSKKNLNSRNNNIVERNFDIFANYEDENAKELSNFFNKIIKTALENLTTIYLENFGFLIPKKELNVNYNNIQNVIHMEKLEVLDIKFEKCLNLNSFFKDKYSPIEFKNLIKNSPIEKNAVFKKFDFSELVRYGKSFVNTIKNEVIYNGVCNLLSIGTLYSTHNRQGEDFSDWFSNADIILKQNFQKSYFLKEYHKYLKPTYTDALEVFKTAYGDYVGKIDVNLRKELILMGFSLDDVKSISETTLPLYVFEDRSYSQKGVVTLYYVTNTLRKYGIKEYGVGTEFVFEISIDEKDYRGKNNLLDIPKCAQRAFVAAWLSLQKKELIHEGEGVVVKYNISLIERGKKSFNAICISDFEELKGIQFSKDGNFFYKNILGITNDEFEFAKRFSVEYILDLLRERNLHQITKLKRRSITDKTERLF